MAGSTTVRHRIETLRLSNSAQHYGAVATVLHWLMAVLIVTLMSLGLYTVRLPGFGIRMSECPLAATALA